jgi:general secretion pathway protein F
MEYRIRALDAAQQIRDIAIEALDEADAREQAAAHQLTPLSVTSSRSFGSRRPRFSLLLFAQELHALVIAGLSVIEALDTLVEKDPAAASGAILVRLRARLRDGVRLSDALAQQPEFFPPLFVGIVQAAEGTSDLPGALGRYIDYETRIDAVRNKILSAAIYPTVLAVVGGGVAFFLLGYVVPRFATVYQGTGRPLPWASQMLLAWGAFAQQHGTALGLALLLAVSTAFWWARRIVRTGGLVNLLGWLPTAKARLLQFEMARLYLTLGMLLEGGIPLARAITLARAVVASHRGPLLDAVRGRVESGEAFSDALASCDLGTTVAYRLIRVGEESGQLGVMLTRAAHFYDAEAARWIDRFMRTFEPVLMAAIGVVVGLIVILLYMPIFDLAGSLQ